LANYYHHKWLFSDRMLINVIFSNRKCLIKFYFLFIDSPCKTELVLEIIVNYEQYLSNGEFGIVLIELKDDMLYIFVTFFTDCVMHQSMFVIIFLSVFML